MADNPRLPAVMDIASPDDMRPYALLCPAFPLGLADAVSLRLRAVFIFPVKPLVVIIFLQVFPQGDAGASG